MTTDLCIEGIHFDRRYASLDQIGYKTLASNLSDIASMGGIPRFFLVSVAFPSEIKISEFRALYQGMKSLAKKTGVVLIGGDTSASKKGLFLNISMVGEVEPRVLVSRSGAKPNDRIFVTGNLGDSAAGLEILTRKRYTKNAKHLQPELKLIQRHLIPFPRIEEGRELALNCLPSAMIDLSDGLATDLGHICEESGVGAFIEVESLPISKALQTYCSKIKRSPISFALTGGEDYELLFSVPKSKVSRMKSLCQKKGVKITEIGEIISKKGMWIQTRKGLTLLKERGFEHFQRVKI
jgi:thiamine-monophosphate kinase